MVFDKTLPIEGALAPTYNNIMRKDKEALEAALNAYFYFATGGTQTGQPRQGSARIYYQDTAPATRLDGDYFDSTDLGCLWIDSNSTIDNQFNWLSAADGAGTDTWTPVSTEIIAFLVAQVNTWALAQTFSVNPVLTKGIVGNNAYLQARNAADNGNVDLIKADGSDVPTVPDDSANATSGAPTADASLANKKYVDDQCDAHITEAGTLQTSTDEVFNGSVTAANTFEDLDLSGTVGANTALVFMHVTDASQGHIYLRPKGHAATVADLHNVYGNPPGDCYIEGAGEASFVTMLTDSAGKLEIACDSNTDTIVITVLSFII